MIILSRPVKLAMIVSLGVFGVLLLLFAVYKMKVIRKKHLREQSSKQEREVFFGNEAPTLSHSDEEAISVLKGESECKVSHDKSVNLDASLLWEEYQNRGSIWRDAFVEMPSPEPAYLTLFVYYQLFRKLLKVHVDSAQNLRLSYSDKDTLRTKVKVIVDTMSGKSTKKMTDINEYSNNPVYDQILSFPLMPDEIPEAKIEASVWSIDEFYKENLIGFVILKLKDYDLEKRTSILEMLQRDVKADLEGGFLLLSLAYQDEAELLSVVVLKGRDLKSPTAHNSPLTKQINPYIVLHLISEGKIIKTKETEKMTDTTHPTFHQLFQFILTREQLNSTDVLLVVLSQEHQLDSSEKLGKILIGCHSAGSKLEHWERMLAAEGKQVAKWHMLEQ